MLAVKLSIGIAWLAFLGAALTAHAQERPAITPLQRQLDALILPEVEFRDADLLGALRYFTQKIALQSGQKVRVPFTIDLPEDFETRYELTLDLNQVPAAEALRYLGTQAGVEFNYEGNIIRVQPLGTASARAAAGKTARQQSKINAPLKGLTGPLAKPAEPASTGNNVHRTTGGAIQGEKSGYIPRRSMSGWTINLDPRNVFGVNCVSHSLCKVGNCGCYVCACKKEPGPKQPR